MTSRFLVVAVVLVLALGRYAGAQIPGNWKKVEAKPTGTDLIVSLKSGTLMEGFLKNVEQDAVTVVLPNGTDLRVAKSDVREIRTRYRDSNKNGALIGLGIGTGLAGAATASATKEDLEGMSRGGFFALGVVVFGGLGTLLGYLIDNVHKESELIYRAQ